MWRAHLLASSSFATRLSSDVMRLSADALAAVCRLVRLSNSSSRARTWRQAQQAHSRTHSPPVVSAQGGSTAMTARPPGSSHARHPSLCSRACSRAATTARALPLPFARAGRWNPAEWLAGHTLPAPTCSLNLSTYSRIFPSAAAAAFSTSARAWRLAAASCERAAETSDTICACAATVASCASWRSRRAANEGQHRAAHCMHRVGCAMWGDEDHAQEDCAVRPCPPCLCSGTPSPAVHCCLQRVDVGAARQSTPHRRTCDVVAGGRLQRLLQLLDLPAERLHLRPGRGCGCLKTNASRCT